MHKDKNMEQLLAGNHVPKVEVKKKPFKYFKNNITNLMGVPKKQNTNSMFPGFQSKGK